MENLGDVKQSNDIAFLITDRLVFALISLMFRKQGKIIPGDGNDVEP
jgi:hypothetical protein